MGIEPILAYEVTCQQCKATITTIGNWQEAPKYGWTVPPDGQLQLCPKCTAFQRREILALAWWNKWSPEIHKAYNRYVHLTHECGKNTKEAEASYKNYTLIILQATEDLNLKEN